MQGGLDRVGPLVEGPRKVGDGVGRFVDRVKRFAPKITFPKKEQNIVEFNDVSMLYRTKSGAKWILRNADFKVPRGRSLAILGKNGAGKSTLLRLLAGVEKPTDGEIDRGVRVSWPLGFAGGFASDVSARDNCIFISRIYGADPAEVIQFVEEFAELGQYFDMPMRTYSSGMKARLAFGMSMAIDFDCYLIDEITAVGDQRFKDKCHNAFEERRETSDVIMISHSVRTIKQYCDTAAILNNGKLVFYEDIDEAIELYKDL